MKVKSWMLMCTALGLVLIMSGVGMSKKQKSGHKVAIFLHAHVDSKDGPARALHALLYARELKESGSDVILIFDGAGTTWVDKLRDPEHKFHKHYAALKDLKAVKVICDACAVAFKVKEKIKDAEIPFSSEYEGHPSITKLLDKGYQIIVI